jgi:hypothetical protein
MRALATIVLVTMFALAACSATATPVPSLAPSVLALTPARPTPASVQSMPGPTASPSVAAPASVPPASAPTPTPSALAPTPAGSAPAPSAPATTTPRPAPEPTLSGDPAADLLAGVRSDVHASCVPLSDGLPKGAVAGLDCQLDISVAERATFYWFPKMRDLLEAYAHRLAAHGVPLCTGRRSNYCPYRRADEESYIPSLSYALERAPYRQATYLDAKGKAHWVGTGPPFVLMAVDGNGDNRAALRDWAWLGNDAQPGSPTLWSGPVPYVP